MTSDSNRTVDEISRSATWKRVAHDAHVFVLPLAGAGALAWGGLLLLGVQTEFGRYLPFGLVLIGSAALGTSFAFHRSNRSEAARSSGPRSAANLPSLPRSVPPASPSFAPGKVSRRRREPTPVSGIGRTAVSVVTQAGDELWRRWVRPRSTSLGAELVGPVPETAYSPPKPGAFVPFPEKDRNIRFVQPNRDGRASEGSSSNSDSEPVWTLRGGFSTTISGATALVNRTAEGSPFSEADLDLLFPRESRPFGPNPPPSPESPNPVPEVTLEPRPAVSPRFRVEPEWRPQDSPVASPRDLSDGLGPLPDGSTSLVERPGAAAEAFGQLSAQPLGAESPSVSSDYSMRLDSTHPAQLLSQGSGAKSIGAPKEQPGLLRQKPGVRTCIVCSRHLSQFRAWSVCPHCREPLCRYCLRLSFASGAEGYCFDCGEAHRWRSG